MAKLCLIGGAMMIMASVPCGAMDLQKDFSPSKKEVIKVVWNLYKDYCENQKKGTMVKVSCDSDLEKLVNYPESEDGYPQVLDNLEITLPLEKIKYNYNYYGVIQLRPINPKEDTLLIGCGNSPIIPGEFPGHDHKGMVTINPEITMNPTIIGAFGVDALEEMFPAQHFSRIVEESTNPIAEMYHQQFKTSLEHVLKPGASFYTVKKQVTYVPEKDINGNDVLEEINESPYDYLTDLNF